jgi:hypothetical protein
MSIKRHKSSDLGHYTTSQIYPLTEGLRRVADSVVHERVRSTPERVHSANKKFTDEQVRMFRKLYYQQFWTIADLAVLGGVAEHSMSAIVRGINYAKVL